MTILSKDESLDTLLQNIVKELREYGESQAKHIKQMTQVGLALSHEKDINKLLEMIVDEARSFSNADAGTLYILDDEKRFLNFEIVQNDTMNTRIGGTSGNKITPPNVNFYKKVNLYNEEGKPNYSNVSSYVAMTGEAVNIPDVYKADNFDFTGPREYDEATGYRSKSMLVIPMKNHINDVIGVLQLLNSTDPNTKEVIPFPPKIIDFIGALASQAAVALNNAQLLRDLKNLFYAFIESIATAIDKKSPYTAGHIQLVVEISMMIAEKINDTKIGPFASVNFSEEEMEELRLAAWMHDVGKITSPEYVVDKATKLQTIIDRIDIIEERFEVIVQFIHNKFLKRKLDLISSGRGTNEKLKELEDQLNSELKQLQDDFEFIRLCNTGGEYMSDEHIDRLKSIARCKYMTTKGEKSYLTENELENLCIRKGTLTEEERKIIENHAEMTWKILKRLPFPKHLAKVPEFAGSHHEKMDSTGYPYGLSGDKLPLQSRILALADVYEALTAVDRPYRGPMKISHALKILEAMKNDKHIDPELLNLFIESGVYLDYAKKRLKPEQIDAKNLSVEDLSIIA